MAVVGGLSGFCLGLAAFDSRPGELALWLTSWCPSIASPVALPSAFIFITYKSGKSIWQRQ